MKVDWDHLRFFLVLARAKTLTNTARLMGVEHSTVARRIGECFSARQYQKKA